MRCRRTLPSAGRHVVQKKQLEFAVRARRDIEAIEAYYLEHAGEAVANRAVDAILNEAKKLVSLGLHFRPGILRGTRESVMRDFPYILVYLIAGNAVKIIRVLHQRSHYFNRRKEGKGLASTRTA